MSADPLAAQDSELTKVGDHQHSKYATHAVNGRHVKRVVYAKLLFDKTAGEVADDPCGGSDDNGAHRADNAGGGRDCGQSGDGAGDDTDQAWLSGLFPLDEHPD